MRMAEQHSDKNDNEIRNTDDKVEPTPKPAAAHATTAPEVDAPSQPAAKPGDALDAPAPAPAAPAVASPAPAPHDHGSVDIGQFVDDGKISPRETMIMQAAMQKLGLYDGPIDGKMDDETNKAIDAFTKKHPELADKPLGSPAFFDALLDDVKKAGVGGQGAQYLLPKDDVKALQEKLGMDDDGLWGTKTQAAFEKFCNENDLDASKGLTPEIQAAIKGEKPAPAAEPERPTMGGFTPLTVTTAEPIRTVGDDIYIRPDQDAPTPDGITVTQGSGVSAPIVATDIAADRLTHWNFKDPQGHDQQATSLSPTAMHAVASISASFHQAGVSGGHEAEHVQAQSNVGVVEKDQSRMMA